MDRFYWLFFVIAGGFFAATGFPVQRGLGVLDFYGFAFLAQALVFVGLCGVAVAIHRQAIDLRRAIGIAAAIWLVCAALSEARVGGIRWLLPLPVIAMITWPRGPMPDEGLLSHLPEPIRQGIAAGLAVVGASILTSGFESFRLVWLRFDYLEIFTGLLMYAVAVGMLTLSLTWQIVIRMAVASYMASLLTFALTRIVGFATLPLVRTDDVINLIICAMLVTQGWRNFMRSDGWLKIVETLVGGFILSLASAAIVEWYNDNTFWVLVGIPFMAFAAIMAWFGLFLIWSDRIWVSRFVRRSTADAQA